MTPPPAAAPAPLPKPFYDDGKGIQIFCGDAQELLPLLPEPALLICDPPYGMDYQSNRKTKHQQKAKIHGDKEFPMWIFDTKATVAKFIFCRWDNLFTIPPPKSFIVWDKGRHSMGDLEHEYGRQWEGIAFYPGENHSFIRRPIDIIRAPCVAPVHLLHPNEKPVEIITPLILAHPPGLIIDCFMGSGTTLVAAKALGRPAIGIDIDESHCRTSVSRLAQEVLAL
jgi:site-specific DNA-methyltransferase (adenine-specific)